MRNSLAMLSVRNPKRLIAMIKAWIALAIAASMGLSISSCSRENDDAVATVRAMTPVWETLQDNSQVTNVGMNESQNKAVVRCWKDQTGGYNGYMCLKVASGALSSITIEKLYEVKLPSIIMPIAATQTGYGCSHVIRPAEQISKNGLILESNEIEIGNARWSKLFIMKYMTENNILGYGYFRCLDILEAVEQGSLATVATTTITRSMVE